MARVEVIGLKSRFPDVLALLREYGGMHVEDVTAVDSPGVSGLHAVGRFEELAHMEGLRELATRLKAVKKALPTVREVTGVADRSSERTAEYERLSALSGDEFETQAASIVHNVERVTSVLNARRLEAESEIALLARYEPAVRKVQPLAKRFVISEGWTNTALLVERRHKAVLARLRHEVDAITGLENEIFSADVDASTMAVVIVYARRHSDAINKMLALQNVNQLRLPQDLQGMPFGAAYAAIRERQVKLPAEIESIRHELADVSRTWSAALGGVQDALDDRLGQIEVASMSGGTEFAFVLEGWAPAEDAPEPEVSLKERFGGEVMLKREGARVEDFARVPVALHNARAVRPFETLIGLAGTPLYGTYDPTWLLFVFYPLFFGMIVGDIGYGAIMLGIVALVRSRYKASPGVQNATSILGLAAASTVFFGLLYNEFFGDVLRTYLGFSYAVSVGGVHLLPIDRTSPSLLLASMGVVLGLGFIQVLIGLALAIRNGVKTHRPSQVAEKSGTALFLLGTVAVVLTLVFSQVFGDAAAWVRWVGGAALAFGFGMAIWGGGLIGMVESISVLANVMSYLRIMAIGLAGAMFAEVSNSIAASTGNLGLALLVAIPLQTLNVALVLFSPNIQSGRLNFVEFFGRFYETSHVGYKPFRKAGLKRGA